MTAFSEGINNYDITKMLSKPRHFDGKETNGSDWKFSMINWMAVLDPAADAIMEKAAFYPSEIVVAVCSSTGKG